MRLSFLLPLSALFSACATPADDFGTGTGSDAQASEKSVTTDRLDVLEAVVASLELEVAGLEVDLATCEAGLTTLGDDVDAQGGRLEDLEDVADDHDDALALLDLVDRSYANTLTALATTDLALASSVAAVGGALDALDLRLDGLDDWGATVDAELLGLGAELDALTTGLAAATTSLDAAVAAVGARVDDEVTTRAAADGALDGRVTTVEGYDERLSTVEGWDTRLTTAEGYGARLDTLEGLDLVARVDDLEELTLEHDGLIDAMLTGVRVGNYYVDVSDLGVTADADGVYTLPNVTASYTLRVTAAASHGGGHATGYYTGSSTCGGYPYFYAGMSGWSGDAGTTQEIMIQTTAHPSWCTVNFIAGFQFTDDFSIVEAAEIRF
ncbi:MAG: hypothetical protein Q8P18_06160 [Pseudomonadota bacterium]|nr:hypothetical protein [Pseudomonadota bacterium]